MARKRRLKTVIKRSNTVGQGLAPALINFNNNINFMHKYTANILKILTLCDYCDKLLTWLEIAVSFIMSFKNKIRKKIR